MSRKDAQALLGILLFYAVIESLGITCPIRFLTGVSCAGCGMSRAWLCLLRLDIAGAFACHPLFWLPLPAAIAFLYRRKLPKAVYTGGAVLVCALFLAVYAVRLFTPDDAIVVWRPEQGLVYRIVSSVLRKHL